MWGILRPKHQQNWSCDFSPSIWRLLTFFKKVLFSLGFMTVISFSSCERNSNANTWLPDMLLRQDWHYVQIEFEPHSPTPHRLTLYLEQFLPQNEQLSLPPKCKSDWVKKGRKPKPTKHNDDMIWWISSKHKDQKYQAQFSIVFLASFDECDIRQNYLLRLVY